jgi:hypothetical protein
MRYDRILSVIIGKLLLEHGTHIEKVYLIATDQKAELTVNIRILGMLVCMENLGKTGFWAV